MAESHMASKPAAAGGTIKDALMRRLWPVVGVSIASSFAEHLVSNVMPGAFLPVHYAGSAALVAVLIKPDVLSTALHSVGEKLKKARTKGGEREAQNDVAPNLLEPEFVGLDKLKELVDHAITNGEKGIWVIQDPESGKYLAQTDSQFAITEKRFLEGDQPFVKMYMSANGGMKREVIDPVKLREEQKAAPVPAVPAGTDASGSNVPAADEPETVIVASNESPAAGAMFSGSSADDDDYDDDEEYGYQP